MFIAVSPKRIALRRSEMLSERHGTPTEREFERIKSYKHVVPNGTSQRSNTPEASDLDYGNAPRVTGLTQSRSTRS
jgi:hypothetical protein